MATPAILYLPLDSDAEFVLKGVYVICFTQYTTFSFNFAGPSDWYFSQTVVPCQAFSYNAGLPFPIQPEVVYPAGGVIKLNVLNTNTSLPGPNTYAVYFVGTKRFPVDGGGTIEKTFIYISTFTLTLASVPVKA